MRGRKPVYKKDGTLDKTKGENEILDYKPFTQWADDVGLKWDKAGVIVA